MGMKKKKTATKRKTIAKKKPAPKKKVNAVPNGYHTVTPYLSLRNADGAIDFYKRAFGAKELMRMPGPDGKIMHAELRIGESVIFLSDESPQSGCRAPESLGGTTGSLMVYVQNVDAVFNRAVAAGASVKMPVSDMFWGDRYGKLGDPFGHEWGLATHMENVSPKEMKKRAQAFMEQMASGQK
jgi:PhnB protein